jgi:hypothetical protein
MVRLKIADKSQELPYPYINFRENRRKIKNRQSRDPGNIEYTRHKTKTNTKQKTKMN